MVIVLGVGLGGVFFFSFFFTSKVNSYVYYLHWGTRERGEAFASYILIFIFEESGIGSLRTVRFRCPESGLPFD